MPAFVSASLSSNMDEVEVYVNQYDSGVIAATDLKAMVMVEVGSP